MGKHRGKHKIKRVEIAGVAIREVRPGYWMVDFQRDGKEHRVRKCFSDLALAKAWAEGKKSEIVNKGIETLNLSDRLRGEALEASRMLQGTGASIMDCVRDYLRRHPSTAGEMLRQTCDRYLAAMREGGRREVSVYDKGIKFNLFCDAVGEVPTVSVDESRIMEWAEAHGGSKDTIHANAAHIRALLRYYERGGKLKDRGNGDEQPPVTLDVATVQKIMRMAEKHTPDIAAGLACLFFAGLRPHEMLRLSWMQIDLESNVIRLTGENTKTRTMRNVEIAGNLRAWLVRYRKSDGLLVPSPSRYRDQREAVMHACGLTQWPVDVPRHTFATMHYNAHQDAAKTMSELGHFTNPQMFVRHYKGVPVTAAEAAAFWKIAPHKAGAKVVEFQQAAG